MSRNTIAFHSSILHTTHQFNKLIIHSTFKIPNSNISIIKMLLLVCPACSHHQIFYVQWKYNTFLAHILFYWHRKSEGKTVSTAMHSINWIEQKYRDTANTICIIIRPIFWVANTKVELNSKTQALDGILAHRTDWLIHPYKDKEWLIEMRYSIVVCLFLLLLCCHLAIRCAYYTNE